MQFYATKTTNKVFSKKRPKSIMLNVHTVHILCILGSPCCHRVLVEAMEIKHGVRYVHYDKVITFCYKV